MLACFSKKQLDAAVNLAADMQKKVEEGEKRIQGLKEGERVWEESVKEVESELKSAKDESASVRTQLKTEQEAVKEWKAKFEEKLGKVSSVRFFKAAVILKHDFVPHQWRSQGGGGTLS